MKLLAIRHFPTLPNRQGILQGQQDFPVIEDAIDHEMIAANLNSIRQESPGLIFSSPLIRAVRSAEIYGFENAVTDERIAEFDFGEFTGRPKTEMLQAEEGIWHTDFPSVAWGEGFARFSQRVDSFIAEMESRHECVLMFTHGGVIRYLLGKYCRGDLRTANRIIVENNSLNIIQTGSRLAATEHSGNDGNSHS